MSNNEYSTGMEKAKGFVAGLLVGGAIGAGTALLKAPRSGKETLKQLKERAAEAQDKAEDTMDQLRDRAEEVGDEVADRAGEMRDQARSASDDVSQQAEEFGQEIASRVEEGKKRLAKAAK
jgi:gas vesicle protein